ncbi:hypothetical protein QVD17_34863 [Tagetes erecta]|uniref:CCHC-type domain-containing protein n=1 Tax=Tagetes erecta TaxID=13708 RepID=A0AAD8NLU2_TARER|nr:hypothetical protein QVD17_34863 [Tagetes erecta]
MAPNDDSDNRVPRLVNRADFKNWTIRLKHHLCSIDNDLWKSIDKGPHIPTQTAPDIASTYTKDSTEPYPEDNLQPEDLRKVKNDSKAYSLMCKGLPLQVLSRLDAYQTSYTLFKALKSICEGGEQLRSLKKQKLKRQLELYEHIAGEYVHQMMNRFVHLTTEMTNVGAKKNLQDLNDRLLCALLSSWKQTVTLLKHIEEFPMDLDLLIAKIEEVEIDENSRNSDRSGSHAQYKFVVNPSNTVENAFLAQDTAKTDDESDLFVGATFYTDSSYLPSSPIYSQPQSPPRVQAENQSSSSTVQAKVKDVMNILLQDDETKNAFTSFMASFQAYQGSHLTQLDVVLQDLFEMDPDDVEEMDINWQMVMVAYRTQKHAYVNRSYKPNANKTVGFDKSKARCFNYNCYGHFSRECKAPKNQNYNVKLVQVDRIMFTSDLTSSVALVCEIEDEDRSEEGDDQVIKAVSEDSEEYDWSAKSDPTEESESEIALMATSEESFSSAEQPKIAHAATEVELTKMKSSKAILEKLISDRKENRTGLGFTHEPMPKSITNTLPENFNEFDHSPENEQRFKEIQRSKSESEGSEVLLESLKEDDCVTVEVDDEASNKSDPILVQLVEYPELNPKPAETVKDEAEFSGYNDPEYIKWKNEHKASVADQLIKKKIVKKTEVSDAKM